MIMTDFNKILNKAKELESKMKESQEKIKNIQVQGISGANSVKVTLNGDGEMVKLEISPEIIKEEKTIIEDIKKGDVYKKVLETFPDAEMTDLKLKEDK